MGKYARTERYPNNAEGASIPIIFDIEPDANNNEETYGYLKKLTFYQDHRPVNDNWILLENQFKADTFCNPDLLLNIQTMNQQVTIYCNVGK